MYTCSAEAQDVGGQVIVVGPVAAALACAEAAVDALAAEYTDVARQVRVDGLRVGGFGSQKS